MDSTSNLLNQSIRAYINDISRAEATVWNMQQDNNKTSSRIPPIQIAPYLGKLLALLIQLHQPKRILEIGTLLGYSTMWMASVIPQDAHIISLEINEKYAALARENFITNKLDTRITVIVGEALSSLQTMINYKEPAFDFIFIDADKKNYIHYLEAALALSRSNTLIVCDNLIPKEISRGDVSLKNKAEQGFSENSIYNFNQQLKNHPRFDTCIIPTIAGTNGRMDALSISLVK